MLEMCCSLYSISPTRASPTNTIVYKPGVACEIRPGFVLFMINVRVNEQFNLSYHFNTLDLYSVVPELEAVPLLPVYPCSSDIHFNYLLREGSM